MSLSMLYLVEEIINFPLADIDWEVSDIDTSHFSNGIGLSVA